MPSIYLQRDFKKNTYHHIINRGSFKQKIFRDSEDYDTFIEILSYYLRYPKLGTFAKVSDKKLNEAKNKKNEKPYTLIAYCLMPNHFHLLLFQKKSSPTLTKLVQKVSVAYAMYFQHKYQHSGALFQGRFRSIKVYDNEQLLYLTKYIHLNPKNIVAKTERTVLSDYPYSSLSDYLMLSKKSKDWLDSKIILKKFYPKALNPQKRYQAFIADVEDKSKLENLLKKKTLE